MLMQHIATVNWILMKDDTPLHLKFGYQTMLHRERIENELLAIGYVAGSMELRFAVERQREHELAAMQRPGANTYRETSQRLTYYAGRRTTNRLTADEIVYLIDKLNGVNDPVGASALNKLKDMK